MPGWRRDQLLTTPEKFLVKANLALVAEELVQAGLVLAADVRPGVKIRNRAFGKDVALQASMLAGGTAAQALPAVVDTVWVTVTLGSAAGRRLSAFEVLKARSPPAAMLAAFGNEQLAMLGESLQLAAESMAALNIHDPATAAGAIAGSEACLSAVWDKVVGDAATARDLISLSNVVEAYSLVAYSSRAVLAAKGVPSAVLPVAQAAHDSACSGLAQVQAAQSQAAEGMSPEEVQAVRNKAERNVMVGYAKAASYQQQAAIGSLDKLRRTADYLRLQRLQEDELHRLQQAQRHEYNSWRSTGATQLWLRQLRKGQQRQYGIQRGGFSQHPLNVRARQLQLLVDQLRLEKRVPAAGTPKWYVHHAQPARRVRKRPRSAAPEAEAEQEPAGAAPAAAAAAAAESPEPQQRRKKARR